jgi:hypothetical protein
MLRRKQKCLIDVAAVTQDKDIESPSPPAKVAELKAMLQKERRVDGAVASCRCLIEMSALLRGDSPAH